MRNINLKAIMLTIALCVCGFARTAIAGEPTHVSINQVNFDKLGAEDKAAVLVIVDRLEAISNMDRSMLTSSERKALRAETKELRCEAAGYNRHGEVIYISAGTIIIILLLILILK